MFATRIFLILIGFYMFNRLIAQPQLQGCFRDVDLAGAVGRTCERPCRADGTCRKVNRECKCDGLCGYSCLKKACLPPEAPVNGHVTTDSRYIGGAATYRCNRGYTLVGDTQRTCSPDKNWNGTAPVCNPIPRCSPLDQPENGYITYNDDMEPKYVGAVVTYSCNRGYTLVGDTRRTCGSDESWNGTAPVCNPNPRCIPLDEPENGYITYNDDMKLVGTSASYRCREGYSRSGRGRRPRVCQSDTTWSGSEMTCNPVCPDLPELANGGYTIEPRERYVGAVVTYTCNGGYTLSGDTNRTCSPTRTWTDNDPVCIQAYQSCIRNSSEISRQNRRCMRTCTSDEDCFRRPCVCDDICGPSCIPTERPDYCPDISNSESVSVVIDPPLRKFRSTANYSCEEGYEKNEGDEVRTCLGNGEWSGTALNCIPRERCEDPPVIQNAYINGRALYYARNDRVTYACGSGYFGSGFPQTIRCDRTRGSLRWTNTEFECLPKSCGDPGHILNGRRIGTNFVFRQSVRYECDIGYEMEGLDTLYCQSDQQWSRSRPVCHVVTCPADLTTPRNGWIRGNQYNYDDVVTFGCDARYIIEGRSQLRCQANGTWDTEEPTCRLIQCDPPEEPVNGGINSRLDDYGYQATVRFVCYQGLTLIGSAETTCNENEEWSHETPSCVATCTVPQSPRNGGWRERIRSYSRIVHGSSLHYYCNNRPGYRYFKCQYTEPVCDNGEWVPPARNLCQRIGCSTITTRDEHVTITYRPGVGANRVSCNHPDYQAIGTLASFNCSRGYRVPTSMSSQILCESSGWSRNWQPRCEKKLCNRLYIQGGAVTNYVLNGENAFSREQGTVAILACNDGYDMVGESSSVCDDGTWNNTQTRCNARPCNEEDIGEGNWQAIFDRGRSLEDRAYRPHGTFVRFTCTEYGYQTSAEMSCVLGTWEGERPHCEKIPCEDEGIANGVVDYEPPVPEHDSVRTFTCSEGYEIAGYHYSRCDAGNWRYPPPACNEKRCDGDRLLDDGPWNVTFIPSELDDGQASKRPGTNAVLTCEQFGYTIEAGDRVTCSRGDWGDLPTCVRARCSVGKPSQGNVTFRDREQNTIDTPRHDDSRIAQCGAGYVLEGSQQSVCINGEWDESLPVCTERGCPALDDIPHFLEIREYSGQEGVNSFSTGDLIPSRTIVTFQCADNLYRPINNEQPKRCKKGNWRGSYPICDLVTCDVVPDRNADHVWNSRSQQTYDAPVIGDTLSVTCNHGFRLQGSTDVSAELTCGDQRTWVPPLRECVWITCNFPLVFNGEIRLYNTSGHLINDIPIPGDFLPIPGDTIRISCEVGYEVIGNEELSCGDDGNWNGYTPICQEKRCPRIETSGGIILYDGSTKSDATFRDGIVARAICRDLHYLSQSESATCRDGAWEPAAPECIPYRNCSLLDGFGLSRQSQYMGRSFVDNGTLYYVHDSRLEVTCPSGERLNGESRSRCTNGTWVPDVGFCVEKERCPKVETEGVVYYGLATSNDESFIDGTVVRVSCDEQYYYPSGGESSTCREGNWVPDTPACIPYERCSAVGHQIARTVTYFGENVTYDGVQQFAHQSQLRVSCSRGRRLSSEDTSVCLNGTWTPTVASCEDRAACQRPDHQDGRYVTPHHGQVYAHGSSLTVGCSQDMVPIGVNVSVCQDGTWIPAVAPCGINVAAGKDAEQSSIGYGSTANRAVDGNRNTKHNAGSCVHTDPHRRNERNWWSVNLNEFFAVREIVIYNRDDSEEVKERLIGADVRVGKSTTLADNDLVRTIQDVNTNPIRIPVSPEIEGRIVSLEQNNQILNFCEVQVFGESRGVFCPNGCMVPYLENGHYTANGYSVETGTCTDSLVHGIYLHAVCNNPTRLTGSRYWYECDNGVWITGNEDNNFATCTQDRPDVPHNCQPPTNRTDVLYFTTVDYEPIIGRQTFDEGESITSRCTDPTRQAFTGSVKIECRSGRWIDDTPSCHRQPFAIVVRNTKLQEVAPNGTIFVSTAPGSVWIDCVEFVGSSSGRPHLSIRFGQDVLRSYWVNKQRRVRSTIEGPSHTDSGTYTCQRGNVQHSIKVIFKDIRCRPPPYNAHENWQYEKANANKEDGVYLFMETLKLRCTGGFRPTSNVPSTCTYTGEWHPPLARCY